MSCANELVLACLPLWYHRFIATPNRVHAMRCTALGVLLSCCQICAFQIIPPPVTRERHARRRGLARRVCAANARTALAMKDGDTAATNDLHAMLKGVIASLTAAAFMLGAEPALVLAAETTATVATAAPTAALDKNDDIVPSTKLEGELAAQFQKAQAAGSVQDFAKAKKLYNQVIKYAPGYVYGWSNRANVLIAEGDLRGAIADYDRALGLADGLTLPDKWIIHLNRGTTFLALGEDDRALADLNAAAMLNKQKDLYILANRAQALERREDWAAALRDYDDAVNVQPGNVQPWWIRYSLVLFQEGKDFESLACLRRLQSKFEGVGEVQAAMTAVQFGRGDIAGAERAWRGINLVDQQTYLKESYLKNQLKWPPRMISSLEAFDRQQKEADALRVQATTTPNALMS